jgi:hypothetical protein
MRVGLTLFVLAGERGSQPPIGAPGEMFYLHD